MLEHGFDHSAQDSNGDTPLHVVAENNHVGILPLLLEKKMGVNCPNGKGRTPISIAAEKVTRRHSSSTASTAGYRIGQSDFSGDGPIHHVIRAGQSSTAQLLYDEKRDRQMALYLAARGDEAMVQILVSKGANVDGWGVESITPYRSCQRS